MKQKGGSVRQTAQKPAQDPARRGEIEGRARRRGKGVQDAYVPAPHGDGIEEKTDDDTEPEERVRRMDQPAEGETLPQDTQHIEQNAQRRTEQGGAAEQGELLRDRAAHVSRRAAPADRLRAVRRRPRRGGSPPAPPPEARRRPD